MRIIKLRIKYPEQFQQHANKLFISPLHLADKTSLVNIMEIVSGLFLSKRVIYQNGNPIHLTDLGKAFEWLFNIKLGDYHQSKHSKKCTFYTLRFGCSFAAVNTIKPQLL